MSVFTTVEPEQLESFLRRYPIGQAQNLEPIAAGITNTNYFLDTENGRYVLTLYEQHSDDELDYMLGLQQHLAERSVACAAPIKDRRGGLYSNLNQRPAAIIQRLPGEVERRPEARHCALIGTELARFHLAGLDFAGSRPNPRGLDWLLVISDMLDDELSRQDQQLLLSTLQDYRRCERDALPGGAIHADLFHDNALFDGERLGGIFDFDYACEDSFALDIAVVLNDWCIDADGALIEARLTAFLDAYQQLRRLERAEFDALPLMLRFSALRFWMSRLHDKLFPQPGELTFTKDPEIFRSLLQLRSSQAPELQALFLPHFVG